MKKSKGEVLYVILLASAYAIGFYELAQDNTALGFLLLALVLIGAIFKKQIVE